MKGDTLLLIEVCLLLAVIAGASFVVVPVFPVVVEKVVELFSYVVVTLVGFAAGRTLPEQKSDPKKDVS